MRCTANSQTADRAASLVVEWHETLWQPAILRSQPVSASRGAATKPLIQPAFMPHPARRKNLLKPMKIKLTAPRRHPAGFTLTELLVVIAIIAILAAMTLTVVTKVKEKAKVVKAKTELADIVNAINAYENAYSRFPVTAGEQAAAGTNDFTTGLVFGSGAGVNGYTYDNNSNVVAILMAMTTYPNGDKTADFNDVKNPKQTHFLNAKLSGYNPNPATNDPHPPGGVDNTGIYRDPWGNPYIISVDLSYDDQTSDIFYSLQSVSQDGSGPSGFYGLSNPTLVSRADNYLFHGRVMAWSAGPDGKYSAAIGQNAKVGDNKDNVLSWQ
jgi:prepilin-type N-terminal cleavage/methylation domain-containing protein